jgi:hypothetical protein
MSDDVIHASTHGFLLGLQVAERVNQLAAGKTLSHQIELAETVLDIADGRDSLTESAQLLQSLPARCDPALQAADLRDAMQEAATCVVEWYRRQYIA